MTVAAPSYDRKIDIAASVRGAYTLVMDNTRTAVELAWLPFAIIAGAEILELLLGAGGLLGRALGGLIAAIASALFVTTFFVRWNRFVLLGESISPGLLPPGWGAAFWAGIKIGLLIAVPTIVLGIIAAPLAVIAGIALILASVRVSLVFPAASVERPISFRQAWDAVAGNYWRLFGCLVLCALPFVIVQAILGAIGAALPSVLALVFQIAGLAVQFAAIAVSASLLSDVYRGLEPAAPEQRVA